LALEQNEQYSDGDGRWYVIGGMCASSNRVGYLVMICKSAIVTR